MWFEDSSCSSHISSQYVGTCMVFYVSIFHNPAIVLASYSQHNYRFTLFRKIISSIGARIFNCVLLSVEALADIKEEGSTTDAFTSTVLNGNNRDHRLSNAGGSYRDDCFQYVFVFEFPRQLRQLSHIRALLSIFWNY